MKRFIVIYLCILTCINMAGQEDCVLETRFRNPVDTTRFHSQPTLLLFVHSKCNYGHLCPTMRMQEALEKDSLQIRKGRGIKLYVIYPAYNEEDIKTFDSFNPVLSEVVFYTDTKYKGSFSDGNSTPYTVLYDGKGNIYKKVGGRYEDLYELIKKRVRKICPFCNGTGRYTSHNPDFWLDKRHGEPCSICHGERGNSPVMWNQNREKKYL